MSHRVVEIAWLPRSERAWTIFSSARLEAGKLWKDLVTRHHRIRRLRWTWPSKQRWFTWAKGKYPHLSAQSTQQIITDFVDDLVATTAKRKRGHDAHYPWKTPKHRDVVYSNQDATVKEGFLRLPHGKRGLGTLKVKIPPTLTLPGRLMEATLSFGNVRLVCETPDAPLEGGEVVVGCDLGVNTLIAATDGVSAIVVSGREAKASVQYRAKQLAEIAALQAGKAKGSRRHRKLQRRKYAMLGKTANRLKDLCHKATRQVVDAFPRARVIVGEPFNDAAQKTGRRQAQQVTASCCRKIISQLDYKAKGATVVPEAYSSQGCPRCGCRQTCRRIYRCKDCGFSAPRDVVGSLNIRQIGMAGELRPLPGLVPPGVTFRHPSKYPGKRQVVPAEPRHVAPTP
jgi:transposase